MTTLRGTFGLRCTWNAPSSRIIIIIIIIVTASLWERRASQAEPVRRRRRTVPATRWCWRRRLCSTSAQRTVAVLLQVLRDTAAGSRQRSAVASPAMSRILWPAWLLLLTTTWMSPMTRQREMSRQVMQGIRPSLGLSLYRPNCHFPPFSVYLVVILCGCGWFLLSILSACHVGLRSFSTLFAVFSERELFAICRRPSVCPPSVCLSVCHVRAPLLRRLKFLAMFLRRNLDICWHPGKILRRS